MKAQLTERIEITNAEIKTLISCLDEFPKRNAELPVRVWFVLSKNREALLKADELTEKMRVELVKKYGTTDGGSKNITVSQEFEEVFRQDYIELLKTSTILEIEKVHISEFMGMEKMQGVNGIFLFMKHFIFDSVPSLV